MSQESRRKTLLKLFAPLLYQSASCLVAKLLYRGPSLRRSESRRVTTLRSGWKEMNSASTVGPQPLSGCRSLWPVMYRLESSLSTSLSRNVAVRPGARPIVPDYVLDASAILPLLKNAPGADQVRARVVERTSFINTTFPVTWLIGPSQRSANTRLAEISVFATTKGGSRPTSLGENQLSNRSVVPSPRICRSQCWVWSIADVGEKSFQ